MPTPIQIQRGRDELRSVRNKSAVLFVFVAIFSTCVNALMLTGPVYMLQVYDRVLSSRSEATLVALTVLIAFLFLMMGILDFTRGRIMARVGARFQNDLDHRVFDAAMRKAAVAPDERTQTALKDLESIQKFLGAPVFTALFDLPWTPVFLAGIAIFHPMLGLLAFCGGGVLIAISILNQVTTKNKQRELSAATHVADKTADHLNNEAEMVQSLGMRGAAFSRWNQARAAALQTGVAAGDISGRFTASTKTLRLFLQSLMLGMGAYLVLRNELSPGMMIAGSILLGRALAPIEMAIGQWALLQRARQGWGNLSELLGEVPAEAERTELPAPKGNLEVTQITVIPPGERAPSLRGLSFAMTPGQAIGVIGPSGAGKTTLARALTGVWPAASGKIRLDGAALAQYHPDALGQYIGYLPQKVQLFAGTIAENIAKLSLQPDPEKVVEAARKADAHEMILKLPQGYDTRIDASMARLSGGQIQRIGLARAMYGDPVLLVLDEPNSSLDNEGSKALNAAIARMKDAGKLVMIMAHRPSAIHECDMLLVLDHGAAQAFGPKDEVLRAMVQNHQNIAQAGSQGGIQ